MRGPRPIPKSALEIALALVPVSGVVVPAAGLLDTKVGIFFQARYDEAKKQGWIVIQ